MRYFCRSRCGIFEMRNVLAVVFLIGCLGCEIFGMWYYLHMVRFGCGMFGMLDVGDSRCSRYWRFGMLDDWDVRCS